ncbi:MAG: prepilin-type N-terminal cleavage/methylation domain-containing protein [Elusimicrobiaceae bacterium]|nr:prepilin-type N-terminal cleavage/methylation domain-containing protein [Elusimicrobiaceae bacterium]
MGVRVLNKISYKKGFTLIELLVVVLIIGILASIALPKYEMAVMRSRYATLKSNVNALYEAEKVHQMTTGSYTADMEELSINLTGCTLSADKRTCTYPWGMCRADKNESRVSCQDTTTLKNAYVRYFSKTAVHNYGTSSCWAFTKDKKDKYNRLCQLEGGTYVWGAVCTNPTGDGCQIYKLTD